MQHLLKISAHIGEGTERFLGWRQDRSGCEAPEACGCE